MLGKRRANVVVGCPNNVTDAWQSINNSISRKRDRCRCLPMHGRRHRFRVHKGTQILVIMEAYIAFVLCECTTPKYLTERKNIGFQIDRCVFRRCAQAKNVLLPSRYRTSILWR
ncbi:hypothetical protein TcCL_NonESM08433 [Trypanosoma cruzi]|nr:hypothetical protein TcCL_NonESM08433 [Trypanosoma cruzi]